ncbi:hypothetical protein Baya_1683 [Bagarius yarrelli]|uniref:Uncharacterized protein n=1 Tax=Bagarius yarrelli TaxID=175774 RepID=A0A556TLS8_BAGYA|nr:hypothetical protein Baya_1683 [Bagarius yarrelli]
MTRISHRYAADCNPAVSKPLKPPSVKYSPERKKIDRLLYGEEDYKNPVVSEKKKQTYQRSGNRKKKKKRKGFESLLAQCMSLKYQSSAFYIKYITASALPRTTEAPASRSLGCSGRPVMFPTLPNGFPNQERGREGYKKNTLSVPSSGETAGNAPSVSPVMLTDLMRNLIRLHERYLSRPYDSALLLSINFNKIRFILGGESKRC